MQLISCRQATSQFAWFVLFALSFLLALVVPASAGSVLTVNGSEDSTAANSVLSFREALLLANSGLTRCLTNAEKNQVSGASFVGNSLGAGCWNVSVSNPNIGSDFADDIKFTDAATTITSTSYFPQVGQNDDIDGLKPNGSKVALVSGTLANGNALVCRDHSSNNQFRNLIIRDFFVAISGTYVGAIMEGLELYNNDTGIEIYASNVPQQNPRNNRIGGTTVSQRNYIYSNTRNGIRISSRVDSDRTGELNNVIEGNYIGLDAAGNTDKGNTSNGIILTSAFGCRIGGDTTASRNVISGNDNSGIRLEGAGCDNNKIFNNYIGLNSSASAKIANDFSGIVIDTGLSNTISIVGNLIGEVNKGNRIGVGQNGIVISGTGANANIMRSNLVGTNAAANNLGGQVGIYIGGGAQNNILGGTTTAQGNTIGFNNIGVDINGAGTSGTSVKTNRIGLLGDGPETFIPNATGVRIRGSATNNIIGDPAVSFSNLISGNNGTGVLLTGAGTSGNSVAGNYIGVSSTGSVRKPNTANGVLFEAGASGNNLTGNTISANGQNGVQIKDNGTSQNILVKNKIGTSPGGSFINDVGNSFQGVLISNGADNNEVGQASKGNTISGNKNDGVQINGAGTTLNKVKGNIIGLNSGLNARYGNAASGVALLNGASQNQIGGSLFTFATPVETNIIAASDNGIFIADPGTNQNAVLGNIIGTNDSSAAGLGNNRGIAVLNGPQNTVIGDDFPFSNIISGNTGAGIEVQSSNTQFTQIQGNFIGVADYNGTAARPNGSGIRIFNGTSNVLFGGSNAGDRNIVSGNAGVGIGVFDSGTTAITIQNNYVGTNTNGTAATPNAAQGLVIQGGADNVLVIGNLLSGNAQHGVLIRDNGTQGHIFKNNKIGTSASGTADVGNGLDGIKIENANLNTIGGTTASERNIISGNNAQGVVLAGSTATGNIVQGNFIGTSTLETPLGNSGRGISIEGSPGNTIGSVSSGAGNVVGSNGSVGIGVSGAGASNNIIQGNRIGISTTDQDLGNVAGGILFSSGAHDNFVGGVGKGNLIAYNKDDGIRIVDANTTSNALRQNRIFQNIGLGINLQPPGEAPKTATPNDEGFPVDSDTGPNNLQNSPSLTSVSSDSSLTTVTGNLRSTPNTTLVIEFFRATPNSLGKFEGDEFLTSITVVTSAAGEITFSVNIGASVIGQSITATAINTDNSSLRLNDTSEFSAPISVPLSFQFSALLYSVGEYAGNVTVTVTRNKVQGAASVDYATSNGTATQPADYTYSGGTLNFVQGEGSKTFTVALQNDATDESDESVELRLSNPSTGYSLGERDTALLTILDDDTATLNINNVTLPEGNPPSGTLSSTQNATFTLTLSVPSAQTVAVRYRTAPGSASPASARSDYTTTSGILTFDPGETSKTIEVPVVRDYIVESDETFFVNLLSPVNVTIGDGQGLGTITNDDFDTTAPTVGFTTRATVPVGTAPGSGSTVYNNLAPVTGAAADAGSGIAKVDLRLYRLLPSGLYESWNGSAWVTTTAYIATNLDAPAGAASLKWSKSSGWPSGADFPDGLYYLRAYAYDRAGTLASSPVFNFTKASDVGAPTVSFTTSATIPAGTTPINRGEVNDSVPTITGVAADASSGIAKVELRFYRATATSGVFEYWNGTMWVVPGTAADIPYLSTNLNPVAGGADINWSRSGGWPSGANLPDNTYYLRAYAYDRAGQIGSSTVSNFRKITSAGAPLQSRESVVGVANSSSTSITLDFAFPEAANACNFAVKVGGFPVAVQSEQKTENQVTLLLAPGSLEAGKIVRVTWNNGDVTLIVQ